MYRPYVPRLKSWHASHRSCYLARVNALKLLRPVNLILIVFIQYIIQYHIIIPYAGEGMALFSHYQFGLMVVITVLVAGGGYVVNDIYDRRIDALNKPGKDLQSRGVTVPMAWWIYATCVASGLVLTLLLGAPHYLPGLAVYIGATLILWAYSKYLKMTPLAGNVLVSGMSAFVVLILWVAQGFEGITYTENVRYAGGIIWMYTSFAFLSTMIREVIKDMEDAEGDRTYGGRTLPLVIGEKQAKVICIVLDMAMLIVIGWWIVRSYETAPFGVLAMFAATVFIPLAGLIPVIIMARSKSAYHQISQYLKAIMLFATAYLIFL